MKSFFAYFFYKKSNWRWWECLGFAPRSNSFAIEPSVQVCSIFSLSGLAISLRRPSANPPNPLRLIQLLTLTKPIKNLLLKQVFYWWRWWESNPRPLWIKTDIYECSYLLSRTGTESNLT